MTPPNEIDSSCPIDLTVHIIGNKWAIPLLRELFTGPKRPSFLLKALKGISPKTLTERLREMEDRGLVTRTVYTTIPPCVEYSLTPMGDELKELLIVLKRVGTKWKMASKSDCNTSQSADLCSHCLVDETARPCPMDANSLKGNNCRS